MIESPASRPPPALVPTAILLLAAACGEPAAEAGVQTEPWAVAAAAADEDYRHVRRLAERVYTYEFAPAGDPVTTVSLFVVSEEGVLVADGQGSPAETERLLGAIAGITDAPVTHVVVGSDHGDHTGGNAAFPEGTEFIAHPAALRNLEAAAARTDRADDAPPIVLPTRLVEDEAVVRLGDREVRILFLGRGHTDGDLAVHLPGERILFMSEAYVDRVFPLLRSGYPSEWVDVLREAEAMDVDTYVAGHGVRGSVDYGREGVARYRHALERVIAEGRRLHAAGLSADEAVERADLGDLESLPDYGPQAPRAIRRVFMELEGALP